LPVIFIEKSFLFSEAKSATVLFASVYKSLSVYAAIYSQNGAVGISESSILRAFLAVARTIDDPIFKRNSNQLAASDETA
jgi:hypothetical protein